MYALVRLTIRLVLRHNIGRIIVSLLLIAGGLLYGSTSHSSTYQVSNAQNYDIHALEDGTYLFQADGGDTFYIANPQDFTPNITDNDLKNSTNLAILYKNDSEVVEYQAVDETQVTGTGYRIEKLETSDAKGQNIHLFKNNEYIQNPDSFYTNNWIGGGALALAGLLLLLFSVIFPFFKRTKHNNTAINLVNPYDLSSTMPNPYQPAPTQNYSNPTPDPYHPDQTTPNPYQPDQTPNPYAPAQDQPNPYAPTQHSDTNYR